MSRIIFCTEGKEALLPELFCGRQGRNVDISGKDNSNPDNIGKYVAQCIKPLIGQSSNSLFLVVPDLDNVSSNNAFKTTDFDTELKEAILKHLDRSTDRHFAQRLVVCFKNKAWEAWFYAGYFGRSVDGTDAFHLLTKVENTAYEKRDAGKALITDKTQFLQNALASPSFKRLAEALGPSGLCPTLQATP